MSDKRFDTTPKGTTRVRSHTRTLQNGHVINVKEYQRKLQDRMRSGTSFKVSTDVTVDPKGLAVVSATMHADETPHPKKVTPRDDWTQRQFRKKFLSALNSEFSIAYELIEQGMDGDDYRLVAVGGFEPSEDWL